MAQYRLQFGNLTFTQKLGLVAVIALGIAAAIALVIVSLGVAIILLPVVAIALVIGRWRLRKMMAEATRGRPAEGQTIEIDYTVIDRDRDAR